MAIDWKGADVAGGRKHTAMVEVNGIIAPGSDASAERINSALQAAFKDKNTQGVVVRINSPGRQPGPGADHLRRDEAAAREAPDHPALRGGRGRVRLGRLLRRRRRRSHLRRQGEHRRLDRRADERLRLHRPDGQARHRAASAHRRREQGHAGSVLAGGRKKRRAGEGDARRHPPAVHRRGQGRPRQAAEGIARHLQRPDLDRPEKHRPRPCRQPRQSRIRGARGDQGGRNHGLHAEGRHRREIRQALRRRRGQHLRRSACCALSNRASSRNTAGRRPMRPSSGAIRDGQGLDRFAWGASGRRRRRAWFSDCRFRAAPRAARRCDRASR